MDVYILSGFLGSGKTTVLQRLLQNDKHSGRRASVLMNEFGEFAVDSLLIDQHTPLKELLNGCICCTMKDEVELQLLSLYKEHKPDVVYVETTGVAHPIDVFDACLSPLIAPYICVKCIITVVDVARWNSRDQLPRRMLKLITEQVKHADNIILNKCDSVDQFVVDRAMEEIKAFNARASIQCVTYGNIRVNALLERDDIVIENKHEVLHVKKHLHIRSMTYEFQNPIDRRTFLKWMEHVEENIFRIKGFVRFTDDPSQTYIFQYAYGEPCLIPISFSFPNNLVLIGTDLDREKIIPMLQCM
ncbi:GTP-binding protein [Anoxybacillus flavithermus]|uniref:GTP-binding protein n=1 Tax=Anoxybacillus flavithermus TaxID=33934 RepID=A0A2G5RMY0_9BACL|nr:MULTISPECIES: GTP-binding protein [Anoxybacillus]KFZ43495.1 cobalamin biosynthesis protein [Anoxybacillus sp. KU2-6(11)]PIC04070.1 GTP-binding protein [Anoxybacillus flavithermus]